MRPPTADVMIVPETFVGTVSRAKLRVKYFTCGGRALFACGS